MKNNHSLTIDHAPTGEPGMNQIVMLLAQDGEEMGIINCPQDGTFYHYPQLQELKGHLEERGLKPEEKLSKRAAAIIESMFEEAEENGDTEMLRNMAEELYKEWKLSETQKTAKP